MAAPQQPTENRLYTEDEYFAFSETAEERWEFFPVGPLRTDGSTLGRINPVGSPPLGRIRLTAGETLDHATIAANVLAALHATLHSQGCRVFGSDMKIHTGDDSNVFPDVGVVCGGPAFHGGRKDTIANPALVVEVLSPSTSGYELGEKFIHYQTIPALADYLLVFQDRAQVILHSRAGDHWETRLVFGLEGRASLPSVGVTLALADVYAQIEFETEAETPEE